MTHVSKRTTRKLLKFDEFTDLTKGGGAEIALAVFVVLLLLLFSELILFWCDMASSLLRIFSVLVRVKSELTRETAAGVIAGGGDGSAGESLTRLGILAASSMLVFTMSFMYVVNSPLLAIQKVFVQFNVYFVSRAMSHQSRTTCWTCFGVR